MATNNYKKWDVVLVDLNPLKGSEINKTRPCLVISPNAANKHLKTLIVAPLTSTIRNIPTRLKSNVNGQPGEICFDQLKAIDKSRIIKIVAKLDISERKAVNLLLMNMFSEL